MLEMYVCLPPPKNYLFCSDRPRTSPAQVVFIKYVCMYIYIYIYVYTLFILCTEYAILFLEI